MCGIFAYIKSDAFTSRDKSNIIQEFNKIKHRGPDNSKHIFFNNTQNINYVKYDKINDKNAYHNKDNIFFGFHRLAINDLSSDGNQPFISNDGNTILVCNGEIYNYKQLASEYQIELTSNSDCEIILQLYLKFGFMETIKKLDGIFACVLYDKNTNTISVARDRIGISSLYVGINNNNNDIGFCSELKGIDYLFDDIQQFKPGHIWNSINNKYISYLDEPTDLFLTKSLINIDTIKYQIKSKFIKSIQKRVISDRPIGCLLSGGLDSSIVAALLSDELTKTGKTLKTFSVGLKGSVDIEYARIVADYIKSEHHELILTEKDMLQGIESTIKQLETWDTTTIRAGTPMFLLAEYIKCNFNTTVIYSGEGSDESSGSYLYFHNAPSIYDFHNETKRLMRDLYYFDVLRCHKSIAGAGLEVRVPFLDKDFLDFYMNINPKYKIPSYGNIEKYLLRSSFDYGLLPHDVLWRKKEGMSDGVSSKQNSWYQIIQDYASTIYSDDTFSQLSNKYKINKPHSKESLLFREIFNRFYPKRDNTIPYYWLPKWCGNTTEASARVLDVYKE
tara:strand:+ start:8486 stop:10165 length:1680 start_codon:yes stop_codon:yes gene_type:complete